MKLVDDLRNTGCCSLMIDMVLPIVARTSSGGDPYASIATPTLYCHGFVGSTVGEDVTVIPLVNTILPADGVELELEIDSSLLMMVNLSNSS